MYCPHCGVQNERSGGYCRQCGQSLVTVQLAVDRRVDEVIAKFNKAEDMLAGGLLTFGIFFLGALINLVINGPMVFAITAILGFAICLPFVLLGLTRVDRLRRLLETKDFASDRVLEPSAARPAELPAHQTNPLDDAVSPPGSVTEDTTLRLKTPDSE